MATERSDAVSCGHMKTRDFRRGESLARGVLAWAFAGIAGAQEITTRAMNPQRHHLADERLPAPNEKKSVNNRPRTAKMPDKAALNAPAGFRLSVFANDVASARWLVLTPPGDVLVTQKRGHEITLLRDKNGDGVADERKRFGNDENGLNQPLGIAFHDDTVLIANTTACFGFHIGGVRAAGSRLRAHAESARQNDL
jgi:glucose/arabinose dehydrogenase